MKKKLRNLLFVIIVTCIALAYVFHFDRYLTIESLKENRVVLKSLVDRHYIISVFLYIALYILLISFSIPTGGVLTLLGGFLFGVVPATLYVVVGATAGASLAFFMTRYFVGDAIQHRYPRYTQRMNKELSRYGYSYMLMLRLVSVVPFFLVNIAAGATKISFFTFIWTTAVGIIPVTMAFAFAGQELGFINEISDIFSKKLFLAFGALALIAFLPVVFHRFRKRKIV